jgi:hypothetical protein
MLKNLDPDKGGIWNHIASDGEKNTITNSWMLNLVAGLFIGQMATSTTKIWLKHNTNG